MIIYFFYTSMYILYYSTCDRNYILSKLIKKNKLFVKLKYYFCVRERCINIIHTLDTSVIRIYFFNISFLKICHIFII